MTEAEWLNCTKPWPVLDFLKAKVSDRKLRLFGVACCRHVWDCFETKGSRPAVLTAERYADGSATVEEMAVARAGVVDGLELYPDEPIFDPSYWACEAVAAEGVDHCAFYAGSHATYFLDFGEKVPEARYDDVRAAESSVQSDFLRDIFGNPFRPVALNPTCMSPSVISLARAIYDERAFHLMPALADALEEAGSTSKEVLSHCREPGPHVRGCWVVDLLLGKA